MNIDWGPLREIIARGKKFTLVSHVRPDADALGSELAMAAMLERLGKTVRIVNPSEMPDNLRFLDPDQRVNKLGQGITADKLADTDVFLVLDTSSWTQLSEVGALMKKSAAVKVMIDHHWSSDDLGAIEFKDTDAEATGAMIVDLAEALEYELTPQIATWLFCAIATDTGWFRFPSTKSSTYRKAARLIDAGAEPHLLYRQLYEQFTPARVKLAGRVLSRVMVTADGKFAYTSVTREDFEQTGARPVDTEDLVNECLRIAGTVGAFIAVEQQNGLIKFSLRSRIGFDVSQVAEQLGGGGHRQASGAMLPGPLAAAVERVLSAMQAALTS